MIRSILCVEDSEFDRLGISRELRRRGYPVGTLRFVESGEDALALMRSGRLPARYLVLLDMRLPGMSGLDVLEVMTRDEQLARHPVWILSGSDEAALVERARELGARDFYNKDEAGLAFGDVLDDLEAAWLELEGWE